MPEKKQKAPGKSKNSVTKALTEAPAESGSSENNGVLPEDRVQLKPIFGIRPGVYLACVYGVIILIVLFFIFMYPGISNPGSIMVIKSEPWGAAVLVDGVYMKTAPCEIFVPAGQRSIEISLPGFTPKKIDMRVRGRLFASRIFPGKIEINEKLESPDPLSAFVNEASEYAAWTFAGEPSAVYQIPLSLSEGAYRLGPGISTKALQKSMEETISASARFAVSRASVRDLIRAKTLLDNRGLSPSPLSLLNSAEDIIAFLDENPKAALWLASVLTGEAQSSLTGSAWFAEASAPSRSDNPAERRYTGGQASIQAGQLNFAAVNGGTLSGINFPPNTRVETFYISETVISVSGWNSFLQANSGWRLENIDALIREGLVSEDYLNFPGISGVPREGVPCVSWYAAQAYCQWLSNSLTIGASWEVRLPTEAEWEFAAKSGILYASGTSSSDNRAFIDAGRYWEWCADPYVPLGFLSAPSAAITALGSTERSLRGGSWANAPGSISNETRGSLPPSYCSPFVSFRPVIAQKVSGR